MSARISAGRVASLRASLSERDLAVLSDLARVRLLNARQIERLQFSDGSPLSRARRSRRTLKRLCQCGLIARMERRVGGVHAGSAGFIYSLDSPGQQLIGGTGPAGGQRRRRPWQPSAQFQDHVLEVSELYVQLRELEQVDGDVDLLAFEAEPSCWRSFNALGGQQVMLKPDAFVRLGIGDYEQVSFIEVDRGTEHVPTLRRKLAVYVEAFTAGVEQRGGQAFPNVVWIVPDEARAAVLRSQVARLPPEHAALSTVTTNKPINQLNAIKGGEQ